MTSEAGTPRAVPKPGKANIQGKVFFNLEPAEDVDVKLCVVRNMYAECIGEKHVTKTDANGEYFFADLEPKEYGALFVRVFNTGTYIFSGKYGGLTAQKIRAEPDKTFFVPLTTLFKVDLKVLTPKPKARVLGEDLEISWEPYPGAGYYIVELFNFGTRKYHVDNRRTNATSYQLETPVPDGHYRLRIEVYNSSGIKIAQAGNGIEFMTFSRGEL